MCEERIIHFVENVFEDQLKLEDPGFRLERVCLNVAGRDSRVEVAGAGAGKVRGCG